MDRQSSRRRGQADIAFVPGAALYDKSLLLSDFRVLCVLGLGVRGGTWRRRSQVEIARHLSVARSTVQRSLARLEALGWVSIRRERGPGPMRVHMPACYRLNARPIVPAGISHRSGDGKTQS